MTEYEACCTVPEHGDADKKTSSDDVSMSASGDISVSGHAKGFVGSAERAYFNAISKYPLLSREEEIELAKKMRSGTPEERSAAREKLINSNYRLVVKFAFDYLNRGLPLMDLIQEGNIGLIIGIDKFDYTKGCKVSTYVTWWIKQQMGRAVEDKGRMIRLPVHLQEKYAKVCSAREEIGCETGHEATNADVSRRTELSEKKIRDIDAAIERSRAPISLDAPVSKSGSNGPGGEDVSLYAVISEKTAAPERIEERITRNEIHRIMREVLDRDAYRIMCHRYGMLGQTAKNYAEIGKMENLTGEAIRLIDGKSRRKLKKAFDERWANAIIYG